MDAFKIWLLIFYIQPTSTPFIILKQRSNDHYYKSLKDINSPSKAHASSYDNIFE